LERGDATLERGDATLERGNFISPRGNIGVGSAESVKTLAFRAIAGVGVMAG